MTWLIHFKPSSHRAHTDYIGHVDWRLSSSLPICQHRHSNCSNSVHVLHTMVVITSSSVSSSINSLSLPLAVGKNLDRTLIWCAHCNSPLDKTGPQLFSSGTKYTLDRPRFANVMSPLFNVAESYCCLGHLAMCIIEHIVEAARETKKVEHQTRTQKRLLLRPATTLLQYSGSPHAVL